MPSISPTAPTSEEKPARVILAITLLTLKLLSERTIALAAAIFPLIILGAGFYLWLQVLPGPSVLQLIGLGLFAAFALLMLLVRKL